MVELSEMAEFMYDNIVCELFRNKGNAIIEIDISSSRTASPSSLLIAYRYAMVLETIYLIEFRHLPYCQCVSLLFISLCHL